MRRRGGVLVLLIVVWTRPALGGGPVRCTTYEEKTLGRWQSLCGDGTRATSYGNRTLECWDTTIQPVPNASRVCTMRMDPQTKHVDVCCR
jgi:hypothetical protein